MILQDFIARYFVRCFTRFCKRSLRPGRSACVASFVRILRSILPPASCETSFVRILPPASCETSFVRILPPASRNYLLLFFFFLISGPKRSPPSCLPGLSVLTSLGPLFTSSQERLGLCLAKSRDALKTMGQ